MKSAKATPRCLEHFETMVERCLAFAQEAQAAGRPVVGILCEYTPREIILAAGGVPVCLCGGAASMVAPAELDLPATLCPLIKSTYGFSVTRANPFLEMAALLVAETTCDGKKKMYELLAERHPMHVLELPQKPDEAAALAHWTDALRGLCAGLEERFGRPITQDALRDAVRTMNAERALRRELAALMQADEPPLTGRELLDMKSLISAMPADLECYRQALAELPGRRVRGAADDRPVRVLLTGVPVPHGAERVLDLLEARGGLVVCQENCTGLKPLLEDIDETADDLLEAIARKYLHLPCSVMTPNNRRMELLRELASAYRADCVVELVWQACLTYDIESRRVQSVVRDELGLPYLKIETDYSTSGDARLALRIEALYETVRQRQEHGRPCEL